MPNRNPTVVYPPSTPRRSQRLILLHENHNPTTPNPKPTKKPSIQSRTPSVRAKKPPRPEDKVPSLERSVRVSNHKTRNEEKIDFQLSEFRSGYSMRVKRGKTKVCSGDKGIGAEVSAKGKRKHGVDEREQVESLVKGKRKLGGGEIAEGWTKEQELALQTAYFTAKPSPNFWKNVSRL